MPSVSLKRLIVKNKDTHQLFQQLLNLSVERIGVEDFRNELILGVTIHNPKNRLPIELNGETIGWVSGGEQAVVLAGLLTHYALKESERKTLGQEVLTMYREINVIYDFSEKLAKTIDPKVIADLALEEANHVINATGGAVVVSKKKVNRRLELLSEAGDHFLNQKELNSSKSPFLKISDFSSAEIINEVKQESRFSTINPSIESLIYAPLKVKEKVLGLIILFNEKADAYKAADLKLLTTLALQAGVSYRKRLALQRNHRRGKIKRGSAEKG